jgi:CDP-diacylglycerol--glycerol-3-phosphate 3-phosphatidyltransferase
VALSRDIVIKAETGGKLKTASQVTAIIALILDRVVFGVDLYDLGIVLIWVSIVLSVVSGVQYMVSFWRKIAAA